MGEVLGTTNNPLDADKKKELTNTPDGEKNEKVSEEKVRNEKVSAEKDRNSGWFRRGNYSHEETKHLLSLVRNVLPLSLTEWKYIAEEHNKSYPKKAKDEASIKLKFTKLWWTKVPTGNPTIPFEIKEALAIYRPITQCVKAKTLDGSLSSCSSLDEASGLLPAESKLSKVPTSPEHTNNPPAVAPGTDWTDQTQRSLSESSCLVVNKIWSTLQSQKHEHFSLNDFFTQQMLLEQRIEECHLSQKAEDDECKERQQQHMMDMLGVAIGAVASVFQGRKKG